MSNQVHKPSHRLVATTAVVEMLRVPKSELFGRSQTGPSLSAWIHQPNRFGSRRFPFKMIIDNLSRVKVCTPSHDRAAKFILCQWQRTPPNMVDSYMDFIASHLRV